MSCNKEDLCGLLRNTVNSSNLFYSDVQEKQNFNLICAMMDRVDESMAYISSHKCIPKTNDDFLLFMLHACIVKDAVYIVLKKLGLCYKDYIQYKSQFFYDVCIGEPLSLSGDDVPDDDKFFEYVRSLSFAHPLETTRPKFFEKDEEQYSPFIMIDRVLCQKGCVGIHVYSNKKSIPFTIQIPYRQLLDYIYNRYSLICDIKTELEKRLENKEKEWRKHKVDRSSTPEQILKNIKSILEERYVETYDIDKMLSLLTCKYTKEENKNVVEKVQQELIQKIPAICDAIDDLDYKRAYDIYEYILYSRPIEMHDGADYELEKIFCCLSNGSRYGDQLFGKMMAQLFSKGFARNWVVIDIDNMSFEEIQMLTRIACFMEKQKQDNQRKEKAIVPN